LLNKGKELPSDRTALAEVIRIYEKIHTKCWGRFVTLFFDEEGEKKLLSFIHRDFPHLIPERESYRRNFFVPYDEN
jgi:hypothetical protein